LLILDVWFHSALGQLLGDIVKVDLIVDNVASDDSTDSLEAFELDADQI